VSDIKDMKTLVITPEPGREVCDFCTAEPTYRLYACRNFVWLKQGTLTHESIGAWAACELCTALVDAGRWAELTEPALVQFRKQYGYTPSEEQHFREQFRSLHRLFEMHMTKES
jgi:hypothetical protein